jgi:hypothetical protein
MARALGIAPSSDLRERLRQGLRLAGLGEDGLAETSAETGDL